MYENEGRRPRSTLYQLEVCNFLMSPAVKAVDFLASGLKTAKNSSNRLPGRVDKLRTKHFREEFAHILQGITFPLYDILSQ